MSKYLNTLFRFCSQNLLATVFTIVASSLVLGFIPILNSAYYALLFLLFFLIAARSKGISFAPICLLLSCALSLLFNKPPELFKPWERLGLFALVLFVAFPVFNSARNTKLRLSLFQLMMVVICFVGLTSLFCYIIGINFMLSAWGMYGLERTSDTAGWFGGLTRHSMTLSPLCALSATYFLHKLLSLPLSKNQKWIYAGCLFSCLCGCLLSASRIGFAAAAIGCISVSALKFRGRFDKFASKIILSLVVLAALYPVYGGFTTAITEKNETNIEKGSMFASREERWEHRILEWKEHPVFGMGFGTIDTQYTDEYIKSGIVESGSGWLAVLSMTGILGAMCVIYIFLSTLSRLYRRSRSDNTAILLFGLIMVFVIHLFAEGYIYAGGSILCYILWLTLGIGYTYSRIGSSELRNFRFELL